MKVFLLPALLPLAPIFQEGAPAQAGAAPTEAAAAQESEFGAPLIVNGERISDLEIKRFLCYGRGRTALESHKFQALIDQELALRKAAGQDISQYEVSEEEFQRIRQREMGDFEERYPQLNQFTEIERAYESVDLYDLQLRQRLAFDKLFFPGDPMEWPAVTKEAIHAASPEVDLVEDAKRAWDGRKEIADETGEPIEPEDEMFQGLVREQVMGSLLTMVEMKTAEQDIPEEFVLIVDGDGFHLEVRTEEFYEEIKPTVSAQDIELAKMFLALMAATEDKLRETGNMPDEDEFQEHIDYLREQSAQSMFPFDFLALYGHEFPSIESFVDHYRLLTGYRKLIDEDLAFEEGGKVSEAMMAHLPETNTIVGLSRVDVEILLVSAFDFLNNVWIKDGWAKAEKRANEIKAEIDAHIAAIVADQIERRAAAERGENYEGEKPMPFDQWWAEELNLKSDFWDPPMPATGKMPPAGGLRDKGRFTNKTRNDLDKSIGENHYLHFVTASSIADVIFFEMDPGTVAGPFKGPDGYYIPYLKRRRPPSNPLDLGNERHKGVLQEQYARRTFIDFAHQALAEAEVSGL